MPKMKALKDQALAAIKCNYEQIFGEVTDIGKIMKKINNKKSEVKKKSDVIRTGKKKIKLKIWERDLLDLMKSLRNPSMATIPGEFPNIFCFQKLVYNVF